MYRQSLIWGKSRDDYSGEVDLRDVIGIVYGTLTTTFKDAKREAARRNDVMPDKPWNCFSLLQAERTVDLACIGDAQTEFWFMGLQRCIFQCRTDMTVASWPQFIIKRCMMKMKLNLMGGMGKSSSPLDKLNSDSVVSVSVWFLYDSVLYCLRISAFYQRCCQGSKLPSWSTIPSALMQRLRRCLPPFFLMHE